MDSNNTSNLIKVNHGTSSDLTNKRKHAKIENEITSHNVKSCKRTNETNDDSSERKSKSDDSSESEPYYDSELEDFKHCNRVEVPETLPKFMYCEHCSKDGQECSRIRLGRYTLKRTIAIDKCMEWEELLEEYSSIYFEGAELLSYLDNPAEYEAKCTDEFKEKSVIPGCMEELFYAFKYFNFDNRHKKKYEWGEKGLKLFFDKYDFDNKMM